MASRRKNGNGVATGNGVEKTNGHAVDATLGPTAPYGIEDGGGFPPDVSKLMGMEDGRNRQDSPAKIFMTIHNDERAWGETKFDSKDELKNAERCIMWEMWCMGEVDMQRILTVDFKGAIAVKGYAREQALKAEIGSRMGMARGMRGMMGRMFGLGRGQGTF